MRSGPACLVAGFTRSLHQYLAQGESKGRSLPSLSFAGVASRALSTSSHFGFSEPDLRCMALQAACAST